MSMRMAHVPLRQLCGTSKPRLGLREMVMGAKALSPRVMAWAVEMQSGMVAGRSGEAGCWVEDEEEEGEEEVEGRKAEGGWVRHFMRRLERWCADGKEEG